MTSHDRAGGRVRAFDTRRRIWVGHDAPIGPGQEPLPEVRGVLTSDPAALDEASHDLGRVVTARPGAVLVPTTIADIEAMVAFCARHRIPVSARGAAHTTGGQSLTRGGLVVQMRSLDRIHRVDLDEVEVDAGALWLDVARAVGNCGLRVAGGMTDYLRTTVGGTLSVGGITADYRHGGQVDAVRALEIITPASGRVWCSETDNRDLFTAALAGLGQFGIITRARIALDLAPRTVQTHHLYYTDPHRFFRDAHSVLDHGQADEVSAAVLPPTLDRAGKPFYRLTVSLFDTGTAQENRDRSTRVLHRIGVSTSANTALPFADHLEAGTQVLDRARTAGWDELRKPWFAAILPGDTVSAFVSAIEPTLTDMDLPGWIALYPHRAAAFRRPMLRVPRSSRWVWLLGVLTVSATPHPRKGFTERMLERNRRWEARAQALGGVRYPLGVSQWHQPWRHYGEQWRRFVRLKRHHDPDLIMTQGVGVLPVNFEAVVPLRSGSC